MKPEEPIDYNQPVAYDTNGRPLYAHPPVEQHKAAEQLQPAPLIPPVYPDIERGPKPAEDKVEDDIVTRHKESLQKYPQLNLSPGEYVIEVIHRHHAGLIPIIGIATMSVILILFGALFYHFQEEVSRNAPLLSGIMLPALLIVVLVLLITYAAVIIYLDNKLFLTNESIIGESRTSLFAHEEKTVSLGDIAQASYTRSTVFQTLFQYGTIHLLVEGDKAEYNFKFAPDPKEHVALMTNEIEKFKTSKG